MVEYCKPITVENNVWLGGNVTVLPGVTIGHDTVIGAGSVVTKDIPPGVIAVGVPCNVIRPITEEDSCFGYEDY
ncbi:Galactoside O-acetyltransferase [compost metagenome]